MKLLRLAVRRLPGIDDEFLLEPFAPGLNVVIGPNGSGKTSFVRAARALLFPGPDDPAPLELVADWEYEGATFHVERDRERIVWQKDGLLHPGPDLPDARSARCFALGVRDLLSGGDASDTELAAEIGRLMAGGFDVPAVALERFSLRSRHGRREDARLREAQRRVAAIHEEHRTLAVQEERLAALESARDEARRASRELEPLGVARELARTRAALSAEREDLAGFPGEMGALRGNEGQLLQELQDRRESLGHDLEEAERDLAAAERTRNACDLPGGPVPAAELAEWSVRARELSDLERELHSARSSVAAAEGARREAAQSLDPDPAGGPMPADGRTPADRPMPEGAPGLRVEPRSLRRIDRYLARAADLHQRRSALESEREQLATPASHPPRVRLESGIIALRTWLAASDTRLQGRAASGWIVAALATIAIGALLLSGPPPDAPELPGAPATPETARPFRVPGPTTGVLLGVGVAVLLGAAYSWFRGRRRLLAIERSWNELGLEAPESGEPRESPRPPRWSRAAVLARVVELEEAIAAAAIHEQRRARLADVENRLAALSPELSKLDREREELREETGIDPGRSDLDVAVIARAVVSFRQTSETLAAERERAEQLAETRRGRLIAIQEFLDGFGVGPGPDAAALAARLDDLRARSEGWRRADDAMRAAADRCESLTSRITEVAARLERFWADVRLPDADESVLSYRLASLARYRELEAACDRHRRRARELERELEARPDLLGSPLDELESRLVSTRELAEKLGELEHEIGAILAKVGEARRADPMESALAAVESARDELAVRRREVLRRTAGRFLLERVAARYDRDRRPGVLERAMKLFGRFTHHRFELVVDPGGEPGGMPSFRARETTSGAGKALSELSDGTRLQLLLAVRVAFAAHVEATHGVRIPLFLDEVLATTDPDRFHAVAESLCVMVREEDRQIFYLSASEHDAARFEHFARAHGFDAPAITDLAQVRRLSRAVPDARSLEIPLFTKVPSPEGKTPEEFGAALPVPAIDRERPASSIHLFYLLRDDLPTLADLLNAGIETVGQWRALTKAEVAHRIVPRESVARLSARCDLAEEFLELWRIGRGRAVDREVLREAGVTERYLDRFAELATELRGNAARFLAVLEEKSDERARRYRARDREKLATHLREHGYLDVREVLDEAALRSRLLTAVEGHLERGTLTPPEVALAVRQLVTSIAA